MTNICIFCNKKFKSLRHHDATPPKYCASIRDPLRCKDGCNAIITHEPLEIHIQHCKSYIEIQEQNRILELDKKLSQEKLEQEFTQTILQLEKQKQEFTQTILRQEKEIENLKYDAKHDILQIRREYEGVREKISRTNANLERDNAQLQDKLANATSYHAKEFDFLLKRYEMLEASYKSLATICANKPTHITHNNTQNTQNNNSINQYLLKAPTLDLTNPSKLQLIMEEFYTMKHLLQGAKGLANFLAEHYLTETGKVKYLTSDAARFNFKFNLDGIITIDKAANLLIKFVLPIVREFIYKKFIASICANDYSTDEAMARMEELYRCKDEIFSLATENTEFCRQLVAMTGKKEWTQMNKLIEI